MRIDLGWRDYTAKFGDGSVRVKLRPLKAGAVHEVGSLLKEAEGENVVVSVTAMQEIFGRMAEGHVCDLRGLEDENGEPMSVHSISQEYILAPLATELVGELLRISHLTKDEAGNLSGPASTSGSASGALDLA